jgi:hypothetical protein
LLLLSSNTKYINLKKANNTVAKGKGELPIDKLSTAQLKELLLVNQYKLAFTRAQLEAVCEILIKHKLATHEEIWKKTNEHFKKVK